MKDYLTTLARGLEPYVPGEQPKDKKYIKLNTNENPYPPSDKVKAAIASAMSDLRLYPDPEATELRRTIAAYYNEKINNIHSAGRTVQAPNNTNQASNAAADEAPLYDDTSELSRKLTEKNVFVGNGSDEVLAFAFPAFFTGKKIAYPNITYSFYPVYANLFQAEILEIPLAKDLSIDIEDYLTLNQSCLTAGQENDSSKSLEPFEQDLLTISQGVAGNQNAADNQIADDNNTNTAGVSGILLPNPNAPTGRYLPLPEIEKILIKNQDKVILIDEAYIDFGGQTAVGLVSRYENLLVIQTFSKSRSLAGLRVGFAIGSEALIEGLNRVKNSFNSYTLDRLAMAGAEAAIEDEDYFQNCRSKIIDTRELVIESLEQMNFTVIPSKANFIFATHKKTNAEKIFLKLREYGILVRYFKKPDIDQYLRISIGTDEEMDTFLAALREILSFCHSE